MKKVTRVCWSQGNSISSASKSSIAIASSYAKFVEEEIFSNFNLLWL
jgi:hypothetical protein